MLDYQPRSCRRTSAREGRRVQPERHNPHSIATLHIVMARHLLPQLQRLILRIHVHIYHASLWAGVVGRGVPCIFEQFQRG